MDTFEVWSAPYWSEALSVTTGMMVVIVGFSAAMIALVTSGNKTGLRGTLLVILSMLTATAAMFIFISFGVVDQWNRNNDYKVRSLERLGYSHVDLTQSDFTADKGGKYVRGTLHEEDGLFYVLTLP